MPQAMLLDLGGRSRGIKAFVHLSSVGQAGHRVACRPKACSELVGVLLDAPFRQTLKHSSNLNQTAFTLAGANGSGSNEGVSNDLAFLSDRGSHRSRSCCLVLPVTQEARGGWPHRCCPWVLAAVLVE